MQMWNLHSLVPAGQPACLSVCQPAVLGSTGTADVLGHARKWVALGFPVASEAPGVMGEGPQQWPGPLRAGGGGLLWLV